MRGPSSPATSSRRGLLASLWLALAIVVAGCGRRGRPEAPEDADPAYPRRYPVR
jgi:predicted small lipoprotein YifL